MISTGLERRHSYGSTRPSKTAMQSRRAQTRVWLLEYEPATHGDVTVTAARLGDIIH